MAAKSSCIGYVHQVPLLPASERRWELRLARYESGPCRITNLTETSKALAFGFLEALLHAKDRTVIDGERARLESLNRMLDDAGHSRDLYEDFTQTTLDLLDAIAEHLPCRDDGQDLLERFNEDGVSSAIITHFRVSQMGGIGKSLALC